MSTTPPDLGTRPPNVGGGVLQRSHEGRMLTGVCAGLGRYAGLDPVLVRVGFAVLVLGSGIGVFLYIAAFLLMRDTDGGPGYLEQWTSRRFDPQTVLALMAAVFGFGLVMNVVADGISQGTIVVGTLLAIALLAAHSRGVDLIVLARTLPDRISRRRGGRGESPLGPPAPVFDPLACRTRGPEGMAGTGSPPGYVAGSAAEGAAGARYSGAPPAAEPATTVPATTVPPTTGPPAEPYVTEPAAAGHPAASPAGAEPPATEPPGTHAPGAAAPTTELPNVPEEPAPTGAGDGGFRRLSDLVQEARTSAYAAHEPFAPRGPYSPRGQYAGDGDYYGEYGGYPPQRPYDLDVPGVATPARKRPRSFVGLVTIFLAMLVGGIMVATQSSGSTPNLTLAGGAVLITIGAGLLVATWFGRGAGLIAAGTIVSLALIAGSTLNGLPKRIGSYTWAPTTAAQALTEDYSIGIGDGTLDLSDTEVTPGSRTRLDMAISMGSLEVIVPSTARVEVDANVRLGDITVGRSMRSGADMRVETVLEPEINGFTPAPIFELHLKAGLGDVEVRRAA